MSTVIENRVWNSLLQAVEKRLNHQSFETWFRSIQFDGYDETGHILHLRAPNQVVKDWVSTNYSDVISDSLAELNLSSYHVDWIVDDNTSAPADQIVPVEDKDGEFGLNSGGADNSRVNNSTLFSLLEAAESDGLAPSATNFVDIEPLELSLNPKCSFQTFVVGSCNQFAHAASLAVAEAPGKTYNPLYIYGGVGLGKTHLMHAIGHSIKERNRYLRLSYISAEKFMNELINAIRYDKAQTFREK